MIFIMARNHAIASDVARHYHYRPDQWRYLTHPRQLVAYNGDNSGCHTHESANYWDNKAHYDIIDILNQKGIKQHFVTKELLSTPVMKEPT